MKSVRSAWVAGYPTAQGAYASHAVVARTLEEVDHA